MAEVVLSSIGPVINMSDLNGNSTVSMPPEHQDKTNFCLAAAISSLHTLLPQP